MHRHLRHYMNWLLVDLVDLVDAMAPTTGFAGTGRQLVETLQRFADLDTDEVQLIPTGSDVTQVLRVADLWAGSVRVV